MNGKTKIAFLAMVVAAVFLALGSMNARAIEERMTGAGYVTGKCEEVFHSMDTGAKGFVTIDDMTSAFYSNTDPSGYSKAASKVWGQDRNGDGVLALNEYCPLPAR